MATFQWSSVTYTFRWMAINDGHTWQKCVALNGQEIEGNPFDHFLIHPLYGPIWDFNTDQPLTHGGTPHHCRCQLEAYATVHWSEVTPISGLSMDLQIAPKEERFSLSGTITEIRSQLSGLKTDLDSLTMSYHELRELETILMRTLTMLERSTGSKEIQKAINNIQRLISIIRMAQFTIHAFEAASGPIGWAFAISGLAITAVAYADSMMEITS